MCGCVSARVCGCVSVWVCECDREDVSVWVCECERVSVWACECGCESECGCECVCVGVKVVYYLGFLIQHQSDTNTNPLNHKPIRYQS